MKVALVVEWLDTWRGGAETSMQQFLRHVLGLGVELEIITRSTPASVQGLTVHTIPAPGAAPLGGSARFTRLAAAVARDCACDLIHAIVPCPAADIYQPRGGTVAETIERNVALRRTRAARQIKRLVGRLNAKQRLRLRLERKLLGRSPPPVVVAISAYVREQLIRHYGFRTSHVRLIFNGVDGDPSDHAQRRADRADIRRMHNVPENERLAILVAHNFKLKGVGPWIQALARIKARNQTPLWALVVGRQGADRWRKLADRLGLADRVQFVGPTQRIHAYYHAADFLVHPTYYDPCSRVVLEALSSGLPSITTRFDGASEVIEDGVNGYVIESPDDVGTLADRTIRLMDAAVRRRLSQATAALADRISMRRHAEEVVHLYESLLSTEGKQ